MRLVLPLLVSVCVLTGCKSREEKLQAAEEKGNLLAATKAKMVKGVGEALKHEGKEAAQVVSEGTGEVVKALGAGFDKSLERVELKVSEPLVAKGISVTRAARNNTGKENAISAYVKYDGAFSGPLELRAFDRENQEIGRTKIQVDEKEASAGYVDFEFDRRMPTGTAQRFELH